MWRSESEAGEMCDCCTLVIVWYLEGGAPTSTAFPCSCTCCSSSFCPDAILPITALTSLALATSLVLFLTCLLHLTPISSFQLFLSSIPHILSNLALLLLSHLLSTPSISLHSDIHTLPITCTSPLPLPSCLPHRVQYRTMRSSIIDMVMSTDMSKHFEHLQKFKAAFEASVSTAVASHHSHLPLTALCV